MPRLGHDLDLCAARLGEVSAEPDPEAVSGKLASQARGRHKGDLPTDPARRRLKSIWFTVKARVNAAGWELHEGAPACTCVT